MARPVPPAALACNALADPRKPSFFSRYLLLIWPGLLTAAVHVFTAAPTVTGEDSGELITAAYFFGVPHPPGYPSWTLLCGFWTHVFPFGPVAWRANVFSAICTAIAVVLVSYSLRLFKFSHVAAGCAAAAAGLTDSIWSQSVIAEVYALNLAFTGALLACFAHWHQHQRPRALFFAALLFGLGMTNHHILGFAALGCGLWALWVDPCLIRRGRVIGPCALFFITGLIPYVYLPWAARRDVPVKWGETTTISQIWEHVARGQYKGGIDEAPVPMTIGLITGRLDYAVRWMSRQWTPVLIPFLLIGLVALRHRRVHRDLCSLVLLSLFACGPLYLASGGPRLDAQDQHVQEVFLLPLALISAIPLAAGLDWLINGIRTAGSTPRIASYSSRLAGRIVGATVIGILLVANGPHNNMRHYWFAQDHADNLLECMLPGAMIFPSGDHDTFPLIYRTYVDNCRPDVLIADKYGYIDLDLYRDMPNSPGKPRTPEERDRIEEWLIRTSRRPVYYTVKKPSLVENASTVPVGLVYHLLPTGQPLDFEECWKRISYRNLEEVSAPEDWAASFIISDYHYARAMRHLTKKDNVAAQACFAECLAHCRGVRETLNNVASALAEAGLVNEAIHHYEEACRGNWRYSPARWNLAKIFKAIGKQDWAAKVFEDLTRSSPEDFRPYGELGFLARDHFHSPDLARHWWYESLHKNPQQPQIIAALTGLDNIEATTQPTTRPSRLSADTSAAELEPEDSVDAQSVRLPPIRGPTSQHGSTEIEAQITTIIPTPAKLNLGRVVVGRKPHVTLHLRNESPSSADICISKITCGCVTVGPQVQTVRPGESASFQVTFDSGSKLGAIHEAIAFDAGSPPSRIEVPLQAEVVPPLEFHPEELRFVGLAGRAPARLTLNISHAEEVPFSIKEVRLEEHALKATWDAAKNSPRHSIELELTEACAEWQAKIDIHISLDSPRVFQVPIRCEPQLPFRITPSLVYMGHTAG